MYERLCSSQDVTLVSAVNLFGDCSYSPSSPSDFNGEILKSLPYCTFLTFLCLPCLSLPFLHLASVWGSLASSSELSDPNRDQAPGIFPEHTHW